MNVDRARVRIRERAATEVLDLAFVFLRGNARPVALLSAILVLPATAVVCAAATTYGAASYYVAYLGCVAASAAIRCPVLVLCGQAMFSERVDVASVLAETRRNLPTILAIVGRRTLLGATVVGLMWDWFARYHLEEVLLLERLEGEQAKTRLRHLGRRFGPQCHEQLVLHLFLGVVFVVSAVSVWMFAKLIFATEPQIVWLPADEEGVALVGAILLAQVYFAAAKFLFYLNLRTVNEGWDLFLETRAIQGLVERRRPATSAAPRLTRSAALHLVGAAIAIGLAVAPTVRAEEQAPREASQAEVKRALEAGDYPWYDAATDGPSYERLARELDDPAAASERWKWVAWLLDFVALAVLFSIVLYVIRAARQARRPRTARGEAVEEKRAPEALPFDDPDLGFEPERWLSASREAAAKGDYTRAIVCLFNGQLLLLDRTHAIRLGAGRTNRHYLTELGPSSAGREPFSSSIRTFDAVFYGGRGADRERWTRFEEDHRRLMASVASRAS